MKKVLFTLIMSLCLLLMPSVVMGQADFCTGLSQEFAGFFDCTSNFRSFSEFQGGLTAPDLDGFDSSLTQSTDLKSYAKNVANFALGFLGLIAVLIIIYSGFLYVTSRGENDQMENGKKGITYALIGIVIIFSSYALVNTILQAPGGDGTNISQHAQLRGKRAVGNSNFNSMAKEIQTITAELLTEYEKHQALHSRLLNLTNYTPRKFTSRADFIEYLEFLRMSLNDIRRVATPISNLQASIDLTVQNVLNPGIQVIQDRSRKEEQDMFRAQYDKSGLTRAVNDITSGISNWWDSNFGEARNIFECSLPPSERAVDINVSNCDRGRVQGDIIDQTDLGTKIDNAFDQLMTDVVIAALEEDFKDSLNKQKSRLERQQRVLKLAARSNAADTAFLDTSIQEITKLIESNELFAKTSLATDFDKTPFDFEREKSLLNQFKPLITALKDAYTQIIELQFMVPVVFASVTEGSAPLIVTFDASQSFDPRQKSITNDSYEWDIDGNGQAGVEDKNKIECLNNDGKGGSTITCIFKEPGQYTPSLMIKAETKEDEAHVLPGIAYIPISVTAPVAQIKLMAKVKNGNVTTDTTLREYDDKGGLRHDVNIYYVTLSDAKEGIVFDATGTDSATQNDNKSGAQTITRYAWTFNDSGLEVVGSGDANGQEQQSLGNSGVVVGQNAITIERKFNKRGSFNAQLEVTDIQGNIDRKIFTIQVTDLVAHVRTQGFNTGIPGQEFVFDASASKSDITPNLQYKWEVKDSPLNNGEDNFVIDYDRGTDEFKRRFTSPGVKTVTLTVKDGTGNEASDTVSINIESQNPTAIFDPIFIDKNNQPNLVLLDASGSFSPDNPIDNANLGLQYGWRIFNAAEGIDYEIVSGKVNSSSSAQNALIPTEAGNDKLELLFKKKGTYKIEVSVEDKFGKRDSLTKEVVILSVVDVKFGNKQTFATQLTAEGKAEITFHIISKNAQTAQINLGDNSGPRMVRFENGEVEFTHSYNKAGSYEVSIRAEKDNDVNTAKTLIIIGGSDSPIAIPIVKIGASTVHDLSAMPEIYRKTKLSFDASNSINSDGTKTNLSYQWNMGDGRVFTGAVIPSFEYNDLAPADIGYFEVALIVTNTQNISQQDTRIIKIPVVAYKPTLQTVIAKIQPSRDKTPINVTVEAIGAVDRDGKIVNYRFYYFPIANPADIRGVKSVSLPSTTLTIATWGEQDQEVEYGLCVDLTDDDGNEVKCDTLFPNASHTRITVKNGPNEPPKASFQTNVTSIKVGDTVQFTSSSTDPDGEIIEWVYDFEGDGSFTNDPTHKTGTVSHQYTKQSGKEGFKVRLRVTDDKGATSVSQPVTIYVDGVLSPPKAAFTEVSHDRTVEFNNRSSADKDNGGQIVSYIWDFDTRLDSDGDGDPSNDIDSTEANPKHTYKRSGVYNVKLTVKDSEGNENSVTKQVVVQGIQTGKENPFANATSTQTPTSHLESSDTGSTETADYSAYANILRTIPTKNPDTGRITMDAKKPFLTLNFDHLPRDTKRIIIDKNIYFDTNGDGIRNNDVDIERFDLAPLTIEYPPQSQNRPIRLQIMVEATNGQKFIDQADIIFPGSNYAASIDFDPRTNIPAFTYLVIMILVLIIGPYFMTSKKIKKL